MRFIVASYGPRHSGMLLTHLHSIARSHPSARVSVYWQDIPNRLLDPIRALFPNTDFIRTDFDLSSDFLQRISSKLNAWCRAVGEHAHEPQICLADVDTLILRDLSAFFEDPAQIVFTDKPERSPLNSGVILARGGEAASAFFRLWNERTLEILRTPELRRQANDYSLQYGGGDQMALYQMLGYERGRVAYEVPVEGHRVAVRCEPCAVLNETNSLPINDRMHIIHFKSGWQPILLDGRPFTRNRPREKSWEMFTLYLERFSEALTALNTVAGRQFTARDFGVIVPFYYKNGDFSSPLYALWCLREGIKTTGRNFRRALEILGGAKRNK
ncbi:MAG: hypothetical protein JWL59_4156 [Chthoniobacteraceae bacterium]|nr:hypothetical protein [Chthoniobacteraceae bacterium]